jgi:branched-chain amino acid transport system permease protein
MHDFTYYAQILISGLTIGSLYALIAIGYTMVYGILRLINFAHGDMFMVAGFIMIYITSWSSGFLGAGSIAVGLILTLILTVVLGVMIEKVAYKPLRSAPRMSVMISAIGVSYLLQNLSTYVTGGLAQAYPNIPWLRTEIEIGGITVRRLTILLVIALVIVIKHTKMGMAMRAVAKDFDTAQLMGIRIDRVISITFVIGSFLAAVGSILYFSYIGQVSPTIGAMPGLKSFVAAVFGGIGSVPGAVIGSYIIGICETFIKSNQDISIFSNAFTFALLIIILLIKPNGLFGEKLKEKV